MTEVGGWNGSAMRSGSCMGRAKGGPPMVKRGEGMAIPKRKSSLAGKEMAK